MHKLIKKIFFCFLLTVYANHTLAEQIDNGDQVTNDLKQAYESGQFEKAYDIAISNSFTLEGEPEFDFYYGLSAFSLKKYPEAQFCFERLIHQFPNQDRFRLEYARTLFMLQHLEESEIQFQTVMNNNPPLTVRKNILKFIHEIEKRQKNRQQYYFWYGSIGIGGGIDSNINSATDLDTLGNIILSDNSKSIDSLFFSANSNVVLNKILNKRKSLQLNFDSQHRLNEETSIFNYDTARLRLSARVRDQDNSYKFGGSYLRIFLDSEAYQSASGLFFQWQRKWSMNFNSLFDFGFSLREFDSIPDNNNLQPNGSLTLISLTKNAQHAFKLGFSKDQAKNAGNDDQMRDSLIFGYQYSKSFSEKTSLYIGGSYSTFNYQDEHIIFNTKRTDKSSQFVIGGKWKLDKDFIVSLEGGQVYSDSNIEIYDYDRQRAELKLKWLF